MQNQEKSIHIGICTLFWNLFELIFRVGFYSYFAYSYAEVSDVAKNTVFFKLFLALIISLWVLIFFKLCHIKLIIDFIGQTMSENIWNGLKCENNFPFSLMKILNIFNIVLGIYFMLIFIELKDCSYYPETFGYKNTCESMGVITIITLINLILISVSLIYKFFTLGCFCCIYLCSCKKIKLQRPNTLNPVPVVSNQNENSLSYPYALARNKSVKHMTSYLNSYNPITMRPSENECAICLDNSMSPWVILKKCGHNYHSDCIYEWIKHRSNCPQCRTKIDSENMIITQNIKV